jgi:oligoendopeptidase F
LPAEFKVTVWSRLKPYFNELSHRSIASLSDLEQWVFDWNELNALVQEDVNWRYIHFSTNTADERAGDSYNYFVQQILPKVFKTNHQLNQKLFNSPFHKQLDSKKYSIFLREIRNAMDLYNEDNIALETEIKIRSKEYGKLKSQILIDVAGNSYTIQEANNFLQETERALREHAFRSIHQRFKKDTEHLNSLFNELLEMRQQLAQNAGFENYRDYKFKALGRFDYTVEDCFKFHESIKEKIVPLLGNLYKIRQKSLKVDELRPWDLNVNINGNPPLKPFKNTDELIEKSIECLSEIDPFFGECLGVMKKIGHLDLNAREGKRPGGYNMPLPLSGVPFIFMNATHSVKDVTVLAHESGHAVHSFYTKNFRLNSTKRSPKEVAELAAMTMELLAMEHWEVFFDDPAALKEARLQKLESIFYTLTWIAAIDKFQHWIYSNPGHSDEERKQIWLKIFHEFQPEIVNDEGLEDYVEHLWQKQLHVFEVPFYFIEYGFAQLGAIAIWKRYRENPKEAIEDFKAALQLGYTKPIPETYKAAGIQFNFSQEYVKELALYLQHEINNCIF